MADFSAQPLAQDERPLKELVKQLGSDASLLVRQELQLARLEIDDRVAKARKEVLALAIGGAVAYAGLLAICAGLILVLSSWMASWIAALIIGALLVIGGAVLLLVGKVGLQNIDPVPRKAVEGLRMDIRTLQHAAR